MDFWDRVEALRREQNTSYRWIAEKVVEKSETTISGWRSQRVLPRADDAVKIANAFGVSVEYLVTGKGPGAPPDDSLLNELVKLYSRLPPDMRQRLIGMAQALVAAPGLIERARRHSEDEKK